jgi:hypothetical protein
MPQQRDYFEQSLFRRLGVEGLVFYLKETKHSLLKAIQTLVDKSTTKASRKELPELIRQQLIEAGNNTHHEEDKKAFLIINDLAHTNAHSLMVNECKLKDIDIPEDFNTAEALAVYLYLKHRPIFEAARVTYQVNQATGWRLFKASFTSPTHPWESVQADFEERAMANFKTHENAGKHIKATAYNSEERLLIHICYQGSLRTVEDFTDKAEIEARKLHPPIETALVYYHATGLLKVKTHLNKESLAKALRNSFAYSVLENPLFLIDAPSETVVNLENLKTCEDFNIIIENSPLDTAMLIELAFTPSKNSRRRITIKDADNLLKAFDEYNLPIAQIEISKATFRFYYRQGGKRKTTTVNITQSNHSVSTNTTDLGQAVDECFRSWGLISSGG